MKQERQSFDAHYKDLAKFVQPRRGRFLTTDRNKGDKRHSAIINSHATWALRTATTGLFAGTMNPARPWFRLETDDPALMESGPAKVWLGDVEKLIRDVYDEGNLYNMAPVVFEELLLFGTGCMLHVDDFQDVARFYTLTVGSYVVAQDRRQAVTTLAREFELTVFQLVEEFELGNVSPEVKRQWDLGNYEVWFPVAHFIEPNPDFDPRRKSGRFKAWRSVKYQTGAANSAGFASGGTSARFDGDDKFLSRSGFGRTDVEIASPGIGSVIVEAKKGYALPSDKQLLKYVQGASKDKIRKTTLRSIVVLTAYPEEVVHQDPDAPNQILDTPVKYLSWRSAIELAERSAAETSGGERRVLNDFISYLRGMITMQDRQSNMVYVVALSPRTFMGGKTTFIEVVEKFNQYFHPVGNHYPTVPSNYLGFRYYGQLQSIHFVEDVQVITQFGKYFPGTSNEKTDPHFLYKLGPPIRPSVATRSGPIRNMRCYCMLDTLLTCDTVQEALQETKRRLDAGA